MTGSLRVDIKQLSLLATGLARTSDELLYKIGSNLSASEIGHQKLAGSVDEFYTNWDYRRRALAEALSGLSTMLLNAAGIYKATEDGIKEACTVDWPNDARRTPRQTSGGSGSGGGAGSSGSGGGSPYARGDEEWDSMTPEERREYLENCDLDRVGNDESMPPHLRYAVNHVRLEREAAYLESKDPLTDAEAARLESYRQLLDHNPPKQILFFDPTGDGKIAVVEGDLSHAGHVAVKVPGISNSLDNISGPIGEGERLYAETGSGTAVVTWLYDAPVGVSLANLPEGASQILNDNMARQAAPELCSFVSGLNRGLGNQADLTIIGHSYGSLVVGLAAKQGLDVQNVVFIGSPGVGVDSVSEFRLPPGANVYAAEPKGIDIGGGVSVGGDYVSNAGHSVHPFGGVPTEPDFGAQVLDIGTRGKAWESHDDYYAKDSRSLEQLSSIVKTNRPL